jgi:hypothetical protein
MHPSCTFPDGSVDSHSDCVTGYIVNAIICYKSGSTLVGKTVRVCDIHCLGG